MCVLCMCTHIHITSYTHIASSVVCVYTYSVRVSPRQVQAGVASDIECDEFPSLFGYTMH